MQCLALRGTTVIGLHNFLGFSVCGAKTHLQAHNFALIHDSALRIRAQYLQVSISIITRHVGTGP
jgi:hypothetical protein